MPASPAWCSCSGARSGSSCLASTTRIRRLRSRFLCSSLGQHHLAVREWDESKRMRELVSRCPRGPRSGADVGREVLAGHALASPPYPVNLPPKNVQTTLFCKLRTLCRVYLELDGLMWSAVGMSVRSPGELRETQRGKHERGRVQV